MGQPPLVGRRSDLLQLQVLWERAVEERRPQLVSIVAPAGTGKTRLLEEFLARLQAADGVHVATARCLPYGQTLTYWPMRGLLAGLLGSELAHPEVTKQQLSAAFARGGHTPADAARLSDLVLTTLGVEHEGASERESIFVAWRLLVEVCAKQAPVQSTHPTQAADSSDRETLVGHRKNRLGCCRRVDLYLKSRSVVAIVNNVHAIR
jgi:predicted ATPase